MAKDFNACFYRASQRNRRLLPHQGMISALILFDPEACSASLVLLMSRGFRDGSGVCLKPCPAVRFSLADVVILL